MIRGVSGAKIWSEDLSNLLPFYRDTLGLKATVERPDFVVFGQANSASLALGRHSEVKGANTDPARHMVDFETDDIQADYRQLKSKGVEFIDEPTKHGRVTVATFKDPEGNYLQLLQFA